LADNTPLLNPYGTPGASSDHDTVQLAGSVFVNNTSYSGADIKVFIHLYRDDVGEKAARQAEIDVMDVADRQNTVESDISTTQSKLEEVHTGTQEDIRLRRELTKLQQEKGSLKTALVASEENADRARNSIAKSSTKVLAEVQTLSVSIHRDKQAVRACGSTYPKGFTRGPREIAGSLIFTVFNEHVLYEFLDAHASDFDSNTYTSALMDQLPPVDIGISFANEYGAVSRMTIYGVEFVNEGQTMSIEDILTENVVNFVARDLDPMRAVSQRTVSQHQLLISQSQPKRASDLLLEEDYKALKDNISPYERFSRRRNPFL